MIRLNKKFLKLILTAALCALTAMSMAACNENTGESSAADLSSASESTAEVSASSETEGSLVSESSASESSVSSEGSVSSEASESSIEPESSESDFGTIIDEEEEDSGTGYVVVPGVEIGSDEFKAEFDKNPIDEQYNSDMQLAASPSKVQEIIMVAADSWRNAADTAYGDAVAVSEDAEALKTDQEEWKAQLETAEQSIRDNAADGLTGEFEIMLYYRDRTAQLLNIVNDSTGSFVQPDGALRGAG